MTYLGQNIKLIREKWGLTQEEFGFLISATRGMVMQYEKRGTMPKNVTVSNIIKVTGLTKDILTNTLLEQADIEPMSDEDYLAIENYREDPDGYKTEDISEEDLKEMETVKKRKVETLLETLLDEKEARRAETAARLDEVSKDKTKLMDLLELSLRRLEGLTISSYAHLEAYTHHAADLESAGVEKTRKRLLEELNRKKAEFEQVLKGEGNFHAENT